MEQAFRRRTRPRRPSLGRVGDPPTSSAGPQGETARRMVSHEPDHRHPRQEGQAGHRHDHADIGLKAGHRLNGHGDRFAAGDRQDPGKDDLDPGEDAAEEGGDADPWSDLRDLIAEEERGAAMAVRKGGFVEGVRDDADEADTGRGCRKVALPASGPGNAGLVRPVAGWALLPSLPVVCAQRWAA